MSIRSLFLLSSIVCSSIPLGCAGTLHATTAAATAATATVEPAIPAAPSALADAAGTLAGTWQCNGSVFGPDGPSPSSVTFGARLALDRAWLQTEFVVTSGRYPYKFTAYRTFVASSGTWANLIVDNWGGYTVSHSADGITWTGTSSSPMGEMMIRDTETSLSRGRMTMRGQYSLDAGASWNSGYDLSCER